MLKNIKTIIFDLGGVLIDLDRARCVESFRSIGFAQAESLIDFYCPADFFNKLERGELSVEQVCDIIREMAGSPIASEDIKRAYSDFLVTIPIAKLRMLESLRERGFQIFALSNTNELVIEKVRELFSADSRSFEEYFDKLYLSYEMKSLKPDAEIFEMLISDSGINPEQTLFIDDSERNIFTARELGFQVYMAQAFEDFSAIFETI